MAGTRSVDADGQKVLSPEQVAAFHHDAFASDQVRQFLSLVAGGTDRKLVVVDIGGGIGAFAARLQQQAAHEVRVLDLDPESIAICERLGVKCTIGDALAPAPVGDENVATFNMILHHLVGSSENVTRDLQSRALRAWLGHARQIFVNEYIYESYVGNFSTWFIYRVTKSRLLSALASAVAKVVPAFRANTFGVGVHFRASADWRRLFEDAGFRVAGYIKGDDEPISLPQRLLLVKHRRRDSFLLEAAPSQAAA